MSEIKTELEALGAHVLAAAKKKGAGQAAASISRSRFFRVGTRNGRVERLEESSARGLYLRVFVNERYSDASTSDLRPEALTEFVDRVIDGAKVLDPEPDRALPGPDLVRDPPPLDLENFDPAVDRVEKENKLQMALQADEAARGTDEAVFSAEGGFNERRGEWVLITSDGFSGYQRNTSFSVSGSASVRDGDHRRRSQSQYQQGSWLSTLDDPQRIGTEAARLALRSRGAGPVPTGSYDLVLENRAAWWLPRLIIGPLSGSLLHQNRSFLKDMQGKEVAAPIFTLTDDPLLRRGLASRLFDSEGLPARTRPIIAGGGLENYFLDTYYARRLGQAPTTRGPSNLILEPGKRPAGEIIADLDKGIFVTSFLGGNSNSLTGDFSAGIEGYLIENGELGRPVAEVNIAGRIQDLLTSIAEVGSDPFEYSSWRMPTLVLPGVAVAGI